MSMKKYLVLGLGLCMAVAFTSCKSSESAYKKAYEKARQQELAQPQVSDPVDVTPVVAAPATQPAATPVASTPASVREEKVTVVSGTGLKDYSVVCGSFGLKANAESLKKELDAAGYSAMVVYNADRNTYRVVVSSHADRASAALARDQFKARYAGDARHPDFQEAWLLYSIK